MMVFNWIGLGVLGGIFMDRLDDLVWIRFGFAFWIEFDLDVLFGLVWIVGSFVRVRVTGDEQQRR